MAAPQVVLITGCAKGIGQATALHLAKDSQRRFKVYATMRDCSVKQDDLKTKAGDLLDDTLFIHELDVTKQDTIDKTIQEVIGKEGKIDVLINNAGIVQPEWWETADLDKSIKIMETNFFGCVRMTKAVVPIMKANRSGKILQVSSAVGFTPLPIMEDYSASKFALEGFSESIAPGLRKYNIWISIIEPGMVVTPALQSVVNGTLNDNTNLTEMAAAIVDSYKNCPEEDVRTIKDLMMKNPYPKEVQTTIDIAESTQDVILSSKPDFRVQTSNLVKDIASRKFVDPTGNSLIEYWL